MVAQHHLFEQPDDEVVTPSVKLLGLTANAQGL